MDDNIKLIKMMYNDKILEILGIDALIFIDFIQREKTLPGFLAKNTYLKFWNDFFEARLNKTEFIISTSICTYEGI